jgi:glycosyltransferase involved in cell wall biosynthesis
MTPTVSVVIPCYNLGEYLGEAVDSVFAQTFTDFEIVIVDDGSTDERTRTLLANYQRAKTRVIRTENRGLPAARNEGARQTSGRYLCMLDADDRLEPSYMQRSVDVLDAEPALAFVSHWLRTFGDEEWTWQPESCELPDLLNTNTVNGAAMVRREAFLAAGGFDEALRDGFEDWDFWITLVERGFKGRILPEVLFNYRRRGDSMSRDMMKGDLFARLHRVLAQKHAPSYQAHLPSLIEISDREIGHLCTHIRELDREHQEWVAPELQRARDEVAALERKVAAVHARKAAENEHARLSHELEVAAHERAAATERAANLDRALLAAQQEAAALRNSLSWRATAPLRSAFGWLLNIRGPRT